MVDAYGLERATAAWLEELPLEDDGHPVVVLSVVADHADATRISAQETIEVELRASVEEEAGSTPVVHLQWRIGGARYEHRISAGDGRAADLLRRLSAQPLLPLVVSDQIGNSVEVFDCENLFRVDTPAMDANLPAGVGRPKCRHHWRRSGRPARKA